VLYDLIWVFGIKLIFQILFSLELPEYFKSSGPSQILFSLELPEYFRSSGL